MVTEKPSPWLWLLGSMVFAAFFLLLGIGDAQLIDWDENIYAEATRQMLLRGDYLNVYINNHPFAEKPPFFFWEMAISYKLFGVNEFAARFPSTVAGMLMVVLCFLVGKKIGSWKLGWTWGVIYLTSLLPSAFAKAAVIDHTFNFFIASSAFLLYFFDVQFRAYLEAVEKGDQSVSRLTHWKYLTFASICMGLGVLTKGPLGGALPLIAFGGYKLLYRSPRIRLVHFFYCGFLSLGIALSWYMINWITYGESFLEGFIRFQLALFTKTLEGHEGPFFYHFVVAFFGLAPWTPFLFACKPKQIFSDNEHYRPLFFLGLFWAVFILVLMSFVSTKLPHYSASVYIPLSLFVSFNFVHFWENNKPFAKWIHVLYALLLGGLGVFLMMVPYVGAQHAKQQNVAFEYDWPMIAYFAGASLIPVTLVGVVLFWKKQYLKGIFATMVAMFLFTQSLWNIFLPPFLHYIQQPMLDMVKESHQKGRVVFYRYVSFAALFYGEKPIEMLHTYKFPGDPEILNQQHDQDIYVITDKKNNSRLKREHPMVRHVRNEGTFSLFILPKK